MKKAALFRSLKSDHLKVLSLWRKNILLAFCNPLSAGLKDQW